MRSTLPAVFVLCLLALPLGAALPAPLTDPVRLLEAWSQASTRTLAKLNENLVRDTLADWVRLPADRRREGDRALCAALGRLSPPRPTEREVQLGSLFDGALAARRASGENGSFDRRLIEEVALMGESVDPLARVGACIALARAHHPMAEPALLVLARDVDQDVRRAACGSLMGRPREEASAALLEAAIGARDQLQDVFDELLTQHLEQLEAESELERAWTARLSERLGLYVRDRVMDPDWRVAAPAVRLARYAAPERAGVVLTEALRLWTDREARRGAAAEQPIAGTRRMRFECAAALAALTGRDLGADPRRWQQFWFAVRSGSPLQVEVDPNSGTQSTFFGLRLESDSIAFVIDASGSMNGLLHDPTGRFGSSTVRATRFEVARAELLRMLASVRVPTDFYVVLFSDHGDAWRPQATRADESTLSRLDSWLGRKRPDGGTYLSEGFAELFGPRPPAEIDVDTVVVLCDGETIEGAAWAEAWLANHNREAQLVFHCVQIGGARADALSRLVERSGGRFVRIDG